MPTFTPKFSGSSFCGLFWRDEKQARSCAERRIVLQCRVHYGSGPPKYGRVELLAFSALGEQLSTLDVDLISVVTHQSFKRQIKGAVASKIPYGRYTVRVSAPGFRRSERQILLDQSEVFVRMQLSVAVECGEFAAAHGTIHSISAPDAPERVQFRQAIPAPFFPD
jgi:hypothetical protein